MPATPQPYWDAPYLSRYDHPTLAFALSLVAALLIFIQGILVMIGAGLIASIPGASGVAGVLTGIGALAAFIGFLLILFAIYLYVNPDAHLGMGIAILLASVFSLSVGGGFVIGTVLGVIGGVLAIVFNPEDAEPLPLEYSGYDEPSRPQSVLDRPAATMAPAAPATSTMTRPSIGCTTCGEIQPIAGAVYCRRCGARVQYGSVREPVPPSRPSS